jgi:ABC-2 type transport system ATP-binding protein/lipopolysaccharide transport system ATP-binding protein
MSLAIVAEGLGKRYRLGEGVHAYLTLRETLARHVRRREVEPTRDEIWALRDVSLEIMEGDTMGIVGRNGAGKTTFLKAVARIVQPTTGLVRARGRVGALLEVGTGFHPELTGRENVYLNGVILGMSRREVRRRFDDIVAFAGVERFLDTPLKRYSSGMYLRLAFAVAAHVEPDVLIVDEVLAVGDAEFQRRCVGRIGELGREGRTVLFVSHDTGAVGQLCRRAVWLEQGRVQRVGEANAVIDEYLQASLPRATRVDAIVQGAGALASLTLSVLGRDRMPVESPRRDEPLTFEIDFTTHDSVRGLDVALYVADVRGTRVVNENLSDAGRTISGPAQRYVAQVALAPLLAAGDYMVGVWIGNEDVRLFQGDLLQLSVLPLPADRDHRYGVVRPPVRWELETPAGTQSGGMP